MASRAGGGRIEYFMKCGFPPRIQIDDSTVDDICRMCGCWCACHAKCGSEYIVLKGFWNEGWVEGEVPVCFACIGMFYVFPGKVIQVQGASFTIMQFDRQNQIKRTG